LPFVARAIAGSVIARSLAGGSRAANSIGRPIAVTSKAPKENWTTGIACAAGACAAPKVA